MSPVVGNRRRHRRSEVPAVAVVPAADGSVAVWHMRDVSLGGACIVGDGMLISGQKFAFSLYLAGGPPLQVVGKVLRRQLATRRGECAITFEGLDAAQTAAMTQAIEAWADPAHAPPSPDTLVVLASPSRLLSPLMRELRALGRTPLQVASPFEAAAWLQRDSAAILVEQDQVEVAGWNFMNFVRETWPEIRRLVIAKDIHSFRLNIALRCGLVDSVLEKPFRAAALAGKLGAGHVERGVRRRARGAG
jgi:hypothetical protein